jgi:hypothetical protein
MERSERRVNLEPNLGLDRRLRRESILRLKGRL